MSLDVRNVNVCVQGETFILIMQFGNLKVKNGTSLIRWNIFKTFLFSSKKCLLTELEYNFLASSDAEGLLQDTGNMQD
jgi:hypothetical protein